MYGLMRLEVIAGAAQNWYRLDVQKYLELSQMEVRRKIVAKWMTPSLVLPILMCIEQLNM